MLREREQLRRHLDPRTVGAVLCASGVALLWLPSLLAAAIGAELLAGAFWWWARAAADAAEQVPRWGWVRRPATALWLAVAIHAVFPVLDLAHGPALWAQGALREFTGLEAHGAVALFRRVEAAAVVWAGLELLAALPLARAFSDLPGPFLEMRPWLPALLPAAGFAVLWRHSKHWIDVPEVRDLAIVLLMITAVLAVLRAYARRAWTASLRWLVVCDCALAALAVAGRGIAPIAGLLLWIATCGGHMFLLVGELRGAAPRRGMLLTRLWRAATWVALAVLAWAATIGHAPEHLGRLSGVVLTGIAFTTGLAAWLTVGRLVHAEERRKVMRPDPALSVSHIAAVAVLVLGPFALMLAWWEGFEPHWSASVIALTPVVLGGWAATLERQRRPRRLWERLEGSGDVSRTLARRAFDLVVHLERRLVGLFARVIGGIAGPLHDLHSGDAQEYLLFLVGIGVLAVVLPLLR